jgi:hypothetical protein
MTSVTVLAEAETDCISALLMGAFIAGINKLNRSLELLLKQSAHLDNFS